MAVGIFSKLSRIRLIFDSIKKRAKRETLTTCRTKSQHNLKGRLRSGQTRQTVNLLA